ncbi:MAG TPA: sigma-54 dependent transcriptional regulator [Thermoanaerobaculia bacterium]|nr:sigma-54 dependent transcriptional regulator [Thermoanaerobaculia bacterium]
MRNLLQTVEKVLDHDVPVLIRGESGVGKDYLAQAIHACSVRRGEPFVHVDCATIPPDLFESELFGYEKGTFTDATSRRLGRLELARSGSVYFDNIDTLTPPLQAKLLRVLQDRQYTRLGGHQNIDFNARVIASASGDLDSLLGSGAFRRDLFYRINVVTVMIPALRERRDDILTLVKRFAGSKRKVDDKAIALLVAHAWPGNVRELRNAVERAVLTGDGTTIEAGSLPLSGPEFVAAGTRAPWTLEELEENYIRAVLRETRSNYSRAAEMLGINRKTLLEKRRKYGIE